jgi:hypothetical protein
VCRARKVHFPCSACDAWASNRLLKDFIDYYTDLFIENTPEVLKDARLKQIEAGHVHDMIKQEIVDWGIVNGPTLANMYLAQGHLDKQIQVEGELTEEEMEAAILDPASLKLEITAFKKELSVLKNPKKELSQLNTAAKVEVVQVEKEIGRYGKPILFG